MGYASNTLKCLIIIHLPTFCWQTSEEIMGMLAPLKPSLTLGYTITGLQDLVEDGVIELRWYEGRERGQAGLSSVKYEYKKRVPDVRTI